MGNVLVAVGLDGREGTVRWSACALLTVARRLGTPVAVIAEIPGEHVVRTLGRFGASRICHPEPPAARAPETSSVVERTADLLVALARRSPEPVAILLPADHAGHETAARVAVRLDAGLITGAVAVRPGAVLAGAGQDTAGSGSSALSAPSDRSDPSDLSDSSAISGPSAGPIAVQRCLAGSYEVESSVVRGIPVITVGPEAGGPEPAPVTPVLEPVPVPGRAGAGLELHETGPSPRAVNPALEAADVVVAGGRGLGSAAAFGLVEELAAALGGAAAGSHTAAELGWCARDRRVGLTGRTVHPRLYLASGISGSVRHRAGMQGAQTVVAIDTDPSAPLLRSADLGVVGDATRVLPALLAEIRRRRAAGGPDV